MRPVRLSSREGEATSPIAPVRASSLREHVEEKRPEPPLIERLRLRLEQLEEARHVRPLVMVGSPTVIEKLAIVGTSRVRVANRDGVSHTPLPDAGGV